MARVTVTLVLDVPEGKDPPALPDRIQFHGTVAQGVLELLSAVHSAVTGPQPAEGLAPSQ
jgi:hypothetical protein